MFFPNVGFDCKDYFTNRMLFCLFNGQAYIFVVPSPWPEFCILLTSKAEGSIIFGRLQGTSLLVSGKGVQQSYSVSSHAAAQAVSSS